jgi:hypothetical protein
MFLRNGLSRVRVFIRVFILLLLVTLVVLPSSSDLLKAQEESDPPTSQTTPPKDTGPLAVTESEQNPDVSVQVRGLKRTSGGMVTLKFTLINDSSDKFIIADQLHGVAGGYNISGVNLVDAAGKKKYQVVVDSEGSCLCSSGLPYQVEPSSRLSLWAKFPAPPDNVEKVTVVIPHFIPMEDVPISQ